MFAGCLHGCTHIDHIVVDRLNRYFSIEALRDWASGSRAKMDRGFLVEMISNLARSGSYHPDSRKKLDEMIGKLKDDALTLPLQIILDVTRKGL